MAGNQWLDLGPKYGTLYSRVCDHFGTSPRKPNVPHTWQKS